MNLVYENRNEVRSFKPVPSVLKTWLMLNATPTAAKFAELERDFKKPITFNSKHLSSHRFSFLVVVGFYKLFNSIFFVPSLL